MKLGVLGSRPGRISPFAYASLLAQVWCGVDQCGILPQSCLAVPSIVCCCYHTHWWGKGWPSMHRICMVLFLHINKPNRSGCSDGTDHGIIFCVDVADSLPSKTLTMLAQGWAKSNNSVTWNCFCSISQQTRNEHIREVANFLTKCACSLARHVRLSQGPYTCSHPF